MKPRVYIAGPMTNYPDKNRQAFEDAEKRLKAAGFRPVSPHRLELATVADGRRRKGEDMPWSWWMRQAIHLLLDCDQVALLPGWDMSTGAKTEYRLARDLGMPCASLADTILNA